MSTAAFVLGVAGAERLTRLNPELGAVVLEDPTPNPFHQGETGLDRIPHPPAGEGASGRDSLSVLNLSRDAYSPPEHLDHADAAS